MARLRECPDCNATVSTRAAACPKCGRPFRKAARQYGCCGLIAGLTAIGMLSLIVMAVVSPSRPAAVRQEQAAVDSGAVGGLTEADRREIYQANWRAGMKASRQAEAEFPGSEAPTDLEAYRAHAAARKALYDSVKGRNQTAVMKQYGVSREQLEAIDNEGGTKQWPVGEE